MLVTPATVRPTKSNRERIAALAERLPRQGPVLGWQPLLAELLGYDEDRLAELERYDEAATLQRQILDWAESAGEAELAARLRRNLERYESRRPVRQVPG